MTSSESHNRRHATNAFAHWQTRVREGVVCVDRRGMLKAGLAGIAGLSLADLFRAQAAKVSAGEVPLNQRSVILLWMTGGPSHIDMWDPKPDAPKEIRGPFNTISTALPGVAICEHMPKHAAMLNKFTLIRSIDARESNHEPNMVMQTGNREAEPRLNPLGHMYPAIGAVVAKFRGAERPGIPAYAATMRDKDHLAWGGWLGKEFDPFILNQNSGSFQLPKQLSLGRLADRQTLLKDFDSLRKDLDRSGAMQSLDVFSKQAVELVTGKRAREAFDISRETEATRERYTNHPWCQQALLARRLVEAGVAFVTLDLSHHSASGTWDTHGDDIPPYGGIQSGLKPLLPVFDHLITTLVSDLEERGLLHKTLVVAMGEFGRTPRMSQFDGRNHWPDAMTICLAGGGMKHGQVIGSSERDGGKPKDRPVTPAEIAATIYQYMGVPLDWAYLDGRGRPRLIVEENARPIGELV